MMNNNLSENLKKIRKDNNISQEQLAEELGVSRQAISKWESGSAYPEMEKIIQLSEKFDLNIDDLLHRDIREIKGEEKTKKDISLYIDSFLTYITDTINLFCSMSFKSKIKCLFEQCIIALVLLIAFAIIGSIGGALFENLYYLLPNRVYDALISIFGSIFIIIAFVISIAIMVYIFKSRYLDYYKSIKNNVEKEPKEVETEEKTNSSKKDKISFNNKEEKIVIRDPKHSEYKFMNSILKTILFCIKLFVLFILIFLCIGLVGLLAAAVLTIVISKTGIFFIGCLLCCLSCAVIDIVFILLSLNFVFTRKSDKKKMIWSFIISIIVLGIGTGLLSLGVLNFNVVGYETLNDEYYVTSSITREMSDGLFIMNNFEDGIEFIEKNIDNVEIEYDINKACSVDTFENGNNGLHIYSYCNNPMEVIRQILEELNKNEIFDFSSSEIHNVKIYANKSNIKKLKNNYDAYINRMESIEEITSSYERKLEEKNNIIDEYVSKYGYLNEEE